MPPLTHKLKGMVSPAPAREKPLWDGPSAHGPNGGVTYSMLAGFLGCRERFRIKYMEGLRPTSGFNHRIEYGQMWHACEEALAQEANPREVNMALTAYCQALAKQYPMQRDQIEHWMNVCRIQFPEYVEYWSKHADVVDRVPLLQEHVFDVPYRLPSGREVRLRGKWDSVDYVKGWGGGIWLQENKTKGDVNPVQLQRQLTFDMQAMIYMTALRVFSYSHPLRDNVRAMTGKNGGVDIVGVRYNVIRRPLSGGKGSIVQKKGSKNVPAETKEQFYGRVRQYIEDEPDTYFMRWNVPVSGPDIERFRRRCLDPVLEQLCDWYEWVTTEGDHYVSKLMNIQGAEHKIDTPNAIHWQHPFGLFNVLDEGGSTDLDEYLSSGNEAGLERTNKLFTELQ